MMSAINDIEFDSSCRGLSRPGALFVVAFLILLAALLLPLPEKMLDALWVCSFCLAGAVIGICVVAQTLSDLVGFVPMMLGLVFLRLVAQAGTARHVIRDEPAGSLLSWTGSTLASGWPLGAVLICLLLAVAIIFVVFTACQKITLASNGYFRQILPLKRMGIETDIRLGVIDEEQAKELVCRIVSESRFFSGMSRMGQLMRIEVAVCIFILLGCLVVPVANGTIHQSYGVGLLSAIAPSVVALSVFTLIPAMIIAVTCGMLMSRETLALRIDEQDESGSMQAKKITVVALDSGGAEDTGLLNPDFIHHRGPDEYVAEFEPQAQTPPADSLPVSTDISCRNAKEYYEKLSRVICKINNRPRVILLASDKVHSLPVTVAVNIAIRLAQEKQKVLLVDTDSERNAVGSVFDLDAESMRKKVQSSSLENLSVCCVPTDKLNKFLRKDKILNRFATTLIYAPDISAMILDKGGYTARPGTFYFVDDEYPNVREKAAEKFAFCSWLCLIPSLQSVLDSES